MFRRTHFWPLACLGFCLGVTLSSLAFCGPLPVTVRPVTERPATVRPVTVRPVTVTIRGGSRRSIESRELYGVVELSLPLGSVLTAPSPGEHRGRAGDAETAQPEPRTPAIVQTPAAADPLEPGHDPSGDAKRSREKGGDGGTPAPALALSRSALLDRRLIQECVARALRGTARAGVATRLDSLGSRARWAAVLPELRLRGGRSADSSLRLTPTVEDPYRYTQSDGADLFFEIDIKWRLDRLLYDSDELSVERLRSQYSSAQSKRIHDVLDRLADWQENAVRFADPSRSLNVRIEAWVRLSIAGFWLDTFTAGWFGDAVAHRVEALTESASGE